MRGSFRARAEALRREVEADRRQGRGTVAQELWRAEAKIAGLTEKLAVPLPAAAASALVEELDRLAHQPDRLRAALARPEALGAGAEALLLALGDPRFDVVRLEAS